MKNFIRWLEWGASAAAALVALAAIYETFFADPQETGQAQYGVVSYTQAQERATMLENETDPIKRDSVCIPLSALGRSLDAQIPTNARVFLAGMLGPDNVGKLGYYYFLNYYLFPREVSISLGQPPSSTFAGFTGRNPTSLDELTNAGYNLVLQLAPDGHIESHVLKPFSQPAEGPPPISGGDEPIAFLLPLAVALAGTRVVRWLFKELENVLSFGELLASGLALGAFFLTQGILALRMAGARLEHVLGIAVMIWAAVEIFLLLRQWSGQGSQFKFNARQFWWLLLASGLAIGIFFLTQSILPLRVADVRVWQVLAVVVVIWAVVLLFRQRRAQVFKFNFGVRQIWWLLLIPAGLMSWALFRLAGTEGLLEFDAVAFWAFKAKIFYFCAGPQIWSWFRNPALAYAHLDYPLLATLLHTFTYGVLGHVNEFVTKFWNQWMLVLLAGAVLGAGKFPNKKPWLVASVASAIILLPLSMEFARAEGGTIPLFFFVVLGSLQLAVGMAEKQHGRIRLGLLILMGATMVKFEGMVLLVFWGVLLLLDRDSRAAFWPLHRVGLAGLLGLAGWIPYVIFRLHHPAPHPESAWLGVLIKNFGTVLSIAPVVCMAFVSRRFLNNDFASWNAPDNHHAAWTGHWAGWQSLFDQATLGLGWACLLLLLAACLRGGKLRWNVLRLALVFFIFATFIGVVWSATHSDPLNYDGAIGGSERIGGGRYLYQTLMAWFAAGFVLLVRAAPEQPVPPPQEREKPPGSKPKRRGR